MKAIERVNDKCWIWKSFVEAERILKTDYADYHMEVVGHLRELEIWKKHRLKCLYTTI